MPLASGRPKNWTFTVPPFGSEAMTSRVGGRATPVAALAGATSAGAFGGSGKARLNGAPATRATGDPAIVPLDAAAVAVSGTLVPLASFIGQRATKPAGADDSWLLISARIWASDRAAVPDANLVERPVEASEIAGVDRARLT